MLSETGDAVRDYHALVPTTESSARLRLPETGLMESEWRCGITVVVAGSGSPPVSLED